MRPFHPHEFGHRSTNPTPDSESRGTTTTAPGRGDRHRTVAGPTADERGVSPVIGAVLMFGLVFALLAVLQTTAVPALNAELELQHSDRVEDDVLAVGGAVDRVAATGHGESVVVEAGLRYPPRMFFVNPPPVAGTVHTTDPAMVEVANARAAGEAGDYWDGTPRRFESRSLVYSPAYNEYPDAPTTVHESWVAYDRFDGGTRPLGDRRPVDGRRITLVALGGQVSASARSVPLTVGPVSAPAHTVTVRDDGDPITLTVPTRLTETDWEALLGGELDPAGDPTNDRYVSGVDCRREPPDPCELLTVTLEAGTTYELRLGKISLGGGVASPGATYIVDASGDGTSVPEAGTRKLVVDVRDRFDNRVSGVRVDASLDGDGTLRAVSPVSGDDGLAAFVYEAPRDVDGATDVTVTASFGSGRPRETVRFGLRVMDADGSGGTGDPPSANVMATTARTSGNRDRYDVTVDATDPDGDLERVEFELRDPDTGALIDTASASVSGTNDAATERLGALAGERRSDYRIVVTAFDAGDNTGTDGTTVAGSG